MERLASRIVPIGRQDAAHPRVSSIRAPRGSVAAIACLLLVSACAPSPAASPTSAPAAKPATTAAAPAASSAPAPAASPGAASASPAAVSASPAASPAAAAAAPSPSAAPAAANKPAPGSLGSVKWVWTAVSGVNAGAWVAIEAGYFHDEGLDVEPVHIASTSRAIPALVANEAQFSNLDGNVIVQADAQGADVIALFAETNRLVFSVMADQSVASGPDLKGKKLGITRAGSSTHTAALQALQMWNLQPDKDVALIQLSEVPNILVGLQAHQIDAGVVSPPTNTQAKKAGFKELINLATDGPEYVSVTIGALRPYIQAHPDQVLAFARGYARGIHRFKTDKAYSEQVLAKYFEITDQSVLDDTWQQFSQYIPDVPYISVPGMQRIVDEVGATEPKVKGTTPQQYMDQAAVKQLDDQGFFKQLLGQ